MAIPETPKEGQGENYETIKLILEDIKTLRESVSKLANVLEETRKRVEVLEW